MSQQPNFGGFGGFGATPQQPAFGGLSATPQQVPQFGAAVPQQASFGTVSTPQQASFGGAAPQQASFGSFATPQQASFGGAAIPQQASFGATTPQPLQPQQASFGATPQQASFGSAVPQQASPQQATFGVATPQQATFSGGGIPQQAMLSGGATPQQAPIGGTGLQQTPIAMPQASNPQLAAGGANPMMMMQQMMAQMAQMGGQGAQMNQMMMQMMAQMAQMGQAGQGGPQMNQMMMQMMAQMAQMGQAGQVGQGAPIGQLQPKLPTGPKQPRQKLQPARPPTPTFAIDLNNTKNQAGTDLESVIQFDPLIASQTNTIFSQIPNPPPLTPPIGNLKKLYALLNAEFDVLQLNGLKLLTNLATNPNNQMILGQSQVVPLLVKLLYKFEAKDEIILQACWAAANLSANENNRVTLRNAGCLPAMSYLLVTGSAGVQEHVLMALSNLVREQNNKLLFRNAGGLEALCDVLEFGKSEKAKDIALKVLMLQGMSKEDKIKIAECDGISAVVPYMDKKDNPQQQQVGIVIMCQFASDTMFSDHVRIAGALPQFVKLLQSGNIQLIEQAITAITNLAINETNVEALREAGVIQPVINLLNAPQDTLKLKATWAISNLMVSEDNQLKFAELGGIPQLVRQLQSQDSNIRMRAAWGLTNITQHSDFLRSDVGKAGAIPLLLQCLMGNDLPSAEQAFKALVNLALNYENEQRLYQLNAIQGFIQLLSSPMPQIQNYAAMCLVNLSKSDQMRIKFREFGGINTLFMLVTTCQNENLKIQLAKLITNMSINGRNRFLLRQQPQISQFLQQCRMDINPEVKAQAEVAARNLTFPIDKFDETEQTVQPQAISTDMQALINSATKKEETSQAQQDKKLTALQEEILSPRNNAQSAQKDKIMTVNKIMDDMLKTKQEADVEATTSAIASVSLDSKGSSKAEPAIDSEEAKKKEEERQQRRKNIAVELLVTERTYVEGLSMMIKKYMNPMQAASTSKKPVITPEQVKAIFSIAETLYSYHSMLLEGLERRITQWGNETCLGDYIVSMVDFLRCYPQYVNNYDEAIELLTKLEEKPQFTEFLQKLTNSELKGMKIYSYLIMPVQRIPRYIMMLEDLAKRTPESHPDHTPLRSAVNKISEIMTWVDNQKEVYNEQQKIAKLQEQFTLLPKGFNLIEPGRVLIKEGTLEMNSNNAFNIFLFNDVFLIAKLNVADRRQSLRRKDVIANTTKYNYINKVDIRICTLNEFPGDNEKFGISQVGLSFQFLCKSPAEKKEWVEAIQKAIASKPALPGASSVASGVVLNPEQQPAPGTTSNIAQPRQVNW